MSRLKRITSAGDIYDGDCILRSVVLTHTGAAGEVSVSDSAANGGTALLQMRCAADGSAIWRAAEDGVSMGAGIQVESLTGAVSVEFDVI